ncbi:flagellar export chaperone FlgN [Marinisporobacter balticus]|uniref:FlgN protein n=1 Tax=Marinisporobacter balticus TaxID=2018667 RepID=A0A4R2LAY9_9FIRM|nr:flagellar export chaperone FlgN [Marinisporobacter balticus]TCO76445.1 FlgN protein [Marinisporobacter balticus]
MDLKVLIDELIYASQKKEMNLKTLLDLTIAQKSFIKNGDLDKLATAISQKQSTIEKINQMDIDFLNGYNRLKRSLGVTSIEDIDVVKYPALKELKLNISNIMGLLKQIEEIDQNNTKNLKIDFEKVKMDMKKLKEKKQSTKIASSYTKKYAQVQGVFIDHK